MHTQRKQRGGRTRRAKAQQQRQEKEEEEAIQQQQQTEERLVDSDSEIQHVDQDTFLRGTRVEEEDINEDKGLRSIRTSEMIQFGSRYAPAMVHVEEEEEEADDTMSELSEIDFEVASQDFMMPEDSDGRPLTAAYGIERISPEQYETSATTKLELLKLVQHLAQRNRQLTDALSQMTGSMLNVANVWALAFVIITLLLLVLYRPYCPMDAERAEMDQPLPEGATVIDRIAHSWNNIQNVLPCVPCPHGLRCSRLAVVGCQQTNQQLKDKTVCVERGLQGDEVWTMSKLMQYVLERKAWKYNCLGYGASAGVDASNLKSLMRESCTITDERAFGEIFHTAAELMESYSRAYKVIHHQKHQTYSSYKFDSFLSCWTGFEHARDHFVGVLFQQKADKVDSTRYEL